MTNNISNNFDSPRSIFSQRKLILSGRWREPVLLFFLYLAVEYFFALPSLRVPFIWDDLHLIRSYTPEELYHVWDGPWDPDLIETPGFRPLTTYFNDIRSMIFGESVVAHRSFMLVLFSLYLVLAGILARRLFDADFHELMLAGLLAFFHFTSVYQYLWISDGVHLLWGILIMSALLAFLFALESNRLIGFLACLLFCSLALLTREDALAVYPLILWFGFALIWLRYKKVERSTLFGWNLMLFFAGLVVVGSLYWIWRSVTVPKSSDLLVNPGALIWAVTQIIQNSGDYRDLINPWPFYYGVIDLWYLWLASLMIIGVLLRKTQDLKQVLIWGVASLLGALPILLTARTNLLLLPVTFWSFLVSALLIRFLHWARTIKWKAYACCMILVALIAPATGSMIFAQDLQPNNLVLFCVSAGYTYIEKHATIPEDRLVLIQRYLLKYGIDSKKNLLSVYPALVKDAQTNHRFGVNYNDLPFIPWFYFVTTYPIQWVC